MPFWVINRLFFPYRGGEIKGKKVQARKPGSVLVPVKTG